MAGPRLRTRRDLCPGVLRPWPADDGALVRVRLVGGRVSPHGLAGLSAVARRHGDGDLHLTGRANLQLRGLPMVDGGLPEAVVDEIAATGLLPSRTHELVRNVMVSPLTGRRGGRADLRPVAAELDRRLLADPVLAALPGRFLFVLDDGRGDLLDRDADLGLVVLSPTTAQLRVGAGWGPVVSLDDAPAALAELARAFLDVRGDGPQASWHVDELATPLIPAVRRDPAGHAHTPPLPHDRTHVAAPDGVLDPALVDRLVVAAVGGDLVVTPWHGVLLPGGTR